MSRSMTDNNHIKFKTGKIVYAFGHRVGINLDVKDSTLYYGYDGEIDPEVPLTYEEKIELADAMIERWMQYKARLKPTTPY